MRDALTASRHDVQVFDVCSHAYDAAEENAQFLAWSELIPTLRNGAFDVVLPALHGGWGEDGTLQTLLEVAGLPYVGTPPRGSRIAMDKSLCKLLMRDIGLFVPRGKIVGEVDAPLLFEGNCVVKPNGEAAFYLVK